MKSCELTPKKIPNQTK